MTPQSNPKTWLILFLLLTFSSGIKASNIVSLAPVSHLIAEALIQDTPLSASYLPPERLPLNRIPAWLNRLDINQLPQADVLLTFESIWPDLAAYPALRQRHIHLVSIDIAQEIAPGGARIIQRPDASEGEFFWLDLNNLTLMVNIAAKDLTRVWPEHAAPIDQNRRQLNRQIQQLALQLDDQLFEQAFDSLHLTDARLSPLALMLALPSGSQGRNSLEISLSNREGHSAWVVDPLLRPTQTSLEAWLISLHEALQQVIDN